jgi:hypothetical protein
MRKVLEANNSFSNSETLTHTEQEEALKVLETMQPLTEALQ